jgi:hypothetical protein
MVALFHSISKQLAKIIDPKYDDQSKSLAFGVDHYNPEGGYITLKLPQVYDNQN